jgi:hypothetical protein
MKFLFSRLVILCLSSLAFLGFTLNAPAQTRTLRIACYNIEDDINGATTPLPGLIAQPSNTNNVQAGGVLEGIGEEIVGPDAAQPPDILAFEETTSNPVTIAPIVSGLNSFYSSRGYPATYGMSTYQATESGGDTADGNGPNAIVYNSWTLQLVASIPVDPSGGTGQLGSSSGEYREVMRYEFAPAGQTPAATNEFYIYVSHYKSGTSSSDLTSRGKEAVIIRNDEANNLPANARVLYVGDYNVTTSSEASYQTIVSNTAPNGVHQGQGFDPQNPAGITGINWNSAALESQMTESATDMRYRDDFQCVTSNVYYAVPGGLCLVTNTYHIFGNNGSTPFQGSVNNGANNSLTNLMANPPITASSLYSYLTTASDHLPVVADYTVPVTVPVPFISNVHASKTNLLLTVSNAVNSFTYTLLQSTNIQQARTNWTPVATNYLTASGSFVFTVTNTPASQAFYTVSAH